MLGLEAAELLFRESWRVVRTDQEDDGVLVEAVGHEGIAEGIALGAHAVSASTTASIGRTSR